MKLDVSGSSCVAHDFSLRVLLFLGLGLGCWKENGFSVSKILLSGQEQAEQQLQEYNEI